MLLRWILFIILNSNMKIWDPETGACLRTLQSGVVDSDKANGKDAGVTSVAIRPTDGRCVVAVRYFFNLP
jgi:hypothetical protein